MKKKTLKQLLKEKGQTSVEYILLISVVAIVSASLFKNLEEYIISNPDSLMSNYINGLNASFGQNGSGEFTYKRFVLRR